MSRSIKSRLIDREEVKFNVIIRKRERGETHAETKRSGKPENANPSLEEELQLKLLHASKKTKRQTLKSQWFEAVEKGHTGKIAELFAADSSLIYAVKDFTGLTALHIAAENGLDMVVKQLLTASPSEIESTIYIPYAGRTPGATALHLAAGKNRRKVVQVLLAARSSVDAIDFEGRTALHYAATSGSCQIVDLLLHSARCR